MRKSQEIMQEIEYDRLGRMRYHPFFHDKQGTRFTESEMIYICKFWDKDKTKNLSLALGRTETSLAKKIQVLKKDWRYEYYKNYDGDYDE